MKLVYAWKNKEYIYGENEYTKALLPERKRDLMHNKNSISYVSCKYTCDIIARDGAFSIALFIYFAHSYLKPIERSQ